MKQASSYSNATAAGAPRVTQDLLNQAQSYLKRRENHELTDRICEAAWSEFFGLCTCKIRRFAFHCGTPENDIADCVQDAWAELIARLPTFQLDPSRGQFETWLFRIVQSKTVNLHRIRKRSLLQETADILHTLADEHAGPDDRSDVEESAELAWILLRNKLSECNLQILQLRLVEQLPGAEVAERLGLTHEQVRYRYHRARRELEGIGAAWSLG